MNIKWTACILLTSTYLCGDISRELDQFFDSFGSHSNVNSAEVYQGQKAGYMTGGGITVKNRVINSNLVQIDLPRIDAGCGGIDIYSGGFSFINKEQLVDTMKSIGSSAMGYAFLLSLETVSPQVANTIKQLQTWANTINGVGINSCETAAQLVGSVWPKESLGSQQICRTLGSSDGAFSDYVTARHKCGQSSEYQQRSDQVKDKYQDIIQDEYNIAWAAIQKQDLLVNNRELAEFFMTLTGTVILRNGKDGKKAIETFPSKIDDQNFLKTLVEGGSAKGYSCRAAKDNKCLSIAEKELKIAPEQGWLGRVQKHLLSMQRKILADQELSADEKRLLATTRLPLYKIVNVLTAYKKGHCPIDLYQVSDIVAMDLIIQYLREVIEVVRRGGYHLRKGQMYSDAVDDYLTDLERIETKIKSYEIRTMHQLEKEFQMMQKIQVLEDRIASEIRLGR